MIWYYINIIYNNNNNIIYSIFSCHTFYYICNGLLYIYTYVIYINRTESEKQRCSLPKWQPFDLHSFFYFFQGASWSSKRQSSCWCNSFEPDVSHFACISCAHQNIDELLWADIPLDGWFLSLWLWCIGKTWFARQLPGFPSTFPFSEFWAWDISPRVNRATNGFCVDIISDLWFGTWILFFHILGIIIPTDELIFFIHRVGIPPTSFCLIGSPSIHTIQTWWI